MAISRVGTATTTDATVAGTLAFPTGWAAGDLLLVTLESRSNDVSTLDPETNPPTDLTFVDSVKPGGVNASQHSIHVYRRELQSGDTAVNFPDYGQRFIVTASVFRSTTGWASTPVVKIGGAYQAASTSVVIPGGTTTVDGTYVVDAIAYEFDSATDQLSVAMANTGLSSYSSLFKRASAGNAGFQHYGAGGEMTTAGTVPDSTATLANSAASGYSAIKIGLVPAASGGGRTATLTAQESGSDTAAISAAVIVTASLGAQEAGQDVAAATIAVQIAGSMAAQEAGSDSLAATLAAAVSASMAAQEAGSDSFAATLTLSSGRVIALVAQETGADTANATASVLISGALAAQEAGQDVAAGAAAVSVSAALAATEAGTDGFAASLSAAVTAALQAQEVGADGMAAAVSVAITATIAAQEAGSDVFTGTLLTVEVVIGPPDIAIPATWPDHRIAATWPARVIPAVWPAPVAIAATWREA